MFRVSVLVAALLVNAPTIWAALGSQTATLQSAVVRVLISIPILAVLLGAVRAAMSPKPQPIRVKESAPDDRS
jgi:hypothetical protein